MNKRIFFVHNIAQRFVMLDLEWLREKYQVEELHQRSRLFNPLTVLVGVLRCDLLFCWFASWHSLTPVLLAKLFGKPSIVVVGGYDVANVPEAGYGSQRGGFQRTVSRLVLNNATKVIAFSEFSRQEAINNAGGNPNKIETIYLGVPALEPDPTHYPDAKRNSNVVLTVGGLEIENLLRKGLLPFVQTAKLLPELSFVLVGNFYDQECVDTLKREAGPNVELTGRISNDRLAKIFGKAKVYVQASLHEGFGMSVAEAMLAYCIPVVTRVGSLPEVVGDTGIYAASNSPEDIAAAVKQAMTRDQQSAEQARQRIIEQFPIERRRNALNSLVDSLLK